MTPILPPFASAEQSASAERALQELNDQQQAIVRHKDGHALVIAGAGSGKTRVIVHRVAHLLSQGVPASAVMMLTFTNKSSREMLERARALLVPQGGGLAEENLLSRMLAGTFHSVANRFLRQHCDLLGYQHNYTILDAADARELARAAASDILGEHPPFANTVTFPKTDAMLDLFSKSFNRHLSLEAQLKEENPEWLDFREHLSAIREKFQARKKTNNCMDFDDLLDNWHKLLLQHGETLELCCRIRYLLVDEYQDTNHIQGEILSLLAKPHGNLMVVGDDAQSIYSWRGASFKNILHFPERFQAKIYTLEQNYRSTPEILELANHSIINNREQFEKHLRPSLKSGKLPTIIQAYDVHQEAEYVATQLRHYCDEEDIPFGQMGVLYRGHAQSAALQTILAQHNIPFVVRSGLKFFEQAHIKDALCFLRVLHNPLDEVAWLRLLRMLPGVGAVAAGKIYRVFAKQGQVSITPDNTELIKTIPKKAKLLWERLTQAFVAMQIAQPHPGEMLQQARKHFYDDLIAQRFDNPKERDADLAYLVDFAMGYSNLEKVLSQLALAQEVAEAEKNTNTPLQDSLVLSSVHQAKGLEWEVVFLIGLSDGKFPHIRCLEPLSKLEEERRVFYVALTRCRRELHLSSPLLSYTGGRAEITIPSRFLDELPNQLTHQVKLKLVEELHIQQRQQNNFTVQWD